MISLILAQKKMLKLITFDLDDTLWDVRPTLINAEKKTREFIETKLGKLEWGSWEEFKEIRKNLIKTDASYEYCLLYTSPSPRDLSTSRMPSSA